MINYAEVLADLVEQRSNLDAAISAIEPMAANGVKPKSGGGGQRKAKRNGRRVKKAEPETDQGDSPGRGRKRCSNCGQTSGAGAKRCQHCMESFG